MTQTMNGKTEWTKGPWEYVPSTEHHGPYVSAPWGGDVCDCYAMSNPLAMSVRNGGDSRPIHHQAERADANARLIAAAPALYEALAALESDAQQEVTDLGAIIQEGGEWTWEDREKLKKYNAILSALSKARGEP